MPSIVLLILSLLFMNACTTSQKTDGLVTDVGIWRGKVLITNQATKKNKWASVVWASDSVNGRMKINVSAVFDYPVATFLKEQDSHDLWLFTEKTHYQSENGRKLFFNLVKIGIDPAIFFDLLGTPKSPGDEWDCVTTPKRFKCQSLQLKTKFSVNTEDPDKRLIKVYNNGKLLQLRLSRSKVQLNRGHFKKIQSSQFKNIKI